MEIPLFSAGFMSLDRTSPMAMEFFYQWKKSMEAGMFIGDWSNVNKTESQDARCQGHRHDLSCASIIAYQLGMQLESGGTYMAYIGDVYGEPNKTVIFHAKGIV